MSVNFLHPPAEFKRLCMLLQLPQTKSQPATPGDSQQTRYWASEPQHAPDSHVRMILPGETYTVLKIQAA